MQLQVNSLISVASFGPGKRDLIWATLPVRKKRMLRFKPRLFRQRTNVKFDFQFIIYTKQYDRYKS